MDELDKEEYEKKKKQEFTKRMLPAMLAIAGFMVFYFMKGGLYESSIDSLMIAMVVSVAVASFIAIEPDKFSYFVVRGLAVLLFFITFSGVCFSILFYESMPFTDPSRLREAQVFLAVSSSGMMGGLMRYFSHEAVIKKEELNLWHMVHAAIVGLFVSVVLFLILRAGIINQTQIDTFNVWGVTGVSAITGFFAERVIERFSSLYNEVVGNSSKQNEGS
ncbi:MULTISPECIES: YEATS-associated helix-containing protein [unclassified Pseudoalteromonas]